MARVNVYDYTDGPKLDGWFYPEKAESYLEDKDWDGNIQISVHTGSEFEHEMLYRTARGRWVLNRYTNMRTVPSYEFIDDEAARKWLIKNRDDAAVARHFGELEEERGPGRPEIGQSISWKPGDDLLAKVDAEATRRGKSRADTLRALVEMGLAAT
jgi:hypothetical protein